MPTWSPLFILPNMRIQNPFESEYLAIVPPEDERCIEINFRHPTFLPFLDRFHGATGDVKALALQLPPDLAYAIDLEVLREDAGDLRLQIAKGLLA
jgi:hypothetical protein